MRKLTIYTIACIVLALPQAMRAATFIVNSPDDLVDAWPGDGACATARPTCTLRAAVMEANALAGADTIWLPAGTYPLQIRGADEDAGFKGDLDITDDLVIHGAGATETRVSGRRIDRVFDVHSPAQVTLSGMTIMLGTPNSSGEPSEDDNGGGMRSNGIVTLSDVAFFRNRSGKDAGGFANFGTAMLTHVRFLHNRAGAEGYAGDVGGMLNVGTATLTDVIFLANRGGEAFDNDGGWVGGMANDGDATLTDVIFRLNRAGDAHYDNGELGVGGNVGGLSNGGNATLTRVTFDRNRAGKGDNGGIGSGGGMTNEGTAIAILNDVIFVRNRAGDCPSSIGRVSGDGGTGGGLFNEATAILTNVTFDRNRAGHGFGPFSRGGDGGAIDDYGTLTLTNVTLTRNRAGNGADGGWGGGLDTATARLTNVTLALNRAGRGHRGGENGSGNQIAGGDRVTLTNTIIFGPGDSCCPGCMPGSNGHNLDSGQTCQFTAPGDLSNTDPLLEPQRRNVNLTNNGGFTPTLALLPGSPAIDAGDPATCPATDQRGVARPQGAACDIGAYEFQP